MNNIKKILIVCTMLLGFLFNSLKIEAQVVDSFDEDKKTITIEGNENGRDTLTKDDFKTIFNKYNDVKKVYIKKSIKLPDDCTKYFYQYTFDIEFEDGFDTSNITCMNNMFREFDGEITGTKNWNVSSVTDMSCMFAYAKATTLDVSDWNVSNVTDMSCMFARTEKLNPDVSKWDVSNVTNMKGMFAFTDMANPDVSNWNVSKVTDMSWIFREAKKANPNVANWNVSSVTNMVGMFMKTEEANPDVSNWNVRNVKKMGAMFYETKKANPNVANWNVSNVTNMDYMFYQAEVAKPNVADWNLNDNVNVYCMFSKLDGSDIINWNEKWQKKDGMFFCNLFKKIDLRSWEKFDSTTKDKLKNSQIYLTEFIRVNKNQYFYSTPLSHKFFYRHIGDVKPSLCIENKDLEGSDYIIGKDIEGIAKLYLPLVVKYDESYKDAIEAFDEDKIREKFKKLKEDEGLTSISTTQNSEAKTKYNDFALNSIEASEDDINNICGRFYHVPTNRIGAGQATNGYKKMQFNEGKYGRFLTKSNDYLIRLIFGKLESPVFDGLENIEKTLKDIDKDYFKQILNYKDGPIGETKEKDGPFTRVLNIPEPIADDGFTFVGWTDGKTMENGKLKVFKKDLTDYNKLVPDFDEEFISKMPDEDNYYSEDTGETDYAKFYDDLCEWTIEVEKRKREPLVFTAVYTGQKIEKKISEKPIIHSVYDTDGVIEGEGISGSIIKFIFPSGKDVTTIVDEYGRWEVEVDEPLYDGDIVKATQKEVGKLESEKAETEVMHIDEYRHEENNKPVDARKVDTHLAYINGYEDSTVKPDGLITRAEVAAMVSRLEGYYVKDYDTPHFPDTNVNWYKPYINSVVKNGIMKGYPDGTFKPNAPITRAELAQILMPLDKKNNAVAPFLDTIGHWAKKAIDNAYGNKRIVGYLDKQFKPDQPITRAEVAAILNRKYNRVADKKGMMKNYYKYIKYFKDLDASKWYYYEMIEATNSHEFKRRGTKDKFFREYEDWIRVINYTVK